MPVKVAGKLGALYFAAGKRHGFENLLVPECRLLIGLLYRTVALACVLLASIPILFGHKKCAPQSRPQSLRSGKRSTTNHFVSEAYYKKRIWPIVTAGTCEQEPVDFVRRRSNNKG
jgi:hypothetical protein